MANENEVDLKAQLAEMQKTIAALAPVAEKVKTLEATIAEKDKAITDLQQSNQKNSQEKAIADLKTKYPDVPESVLKALPEASREAEAKALQDRFGQVKTTVKTGSSAWDNAGIGPSMEAEDAAALAGRQKQRDEAVQKGDLMGVMRAKARDTVDFLRKNYPHAV